MPTLPGPSDREPSWQQVAELPALAAEVVEYQGHFRTCPGWGTLNHAAIPQEIKKHSVGPRLAAAGAPGLDFIKHGPLLACKQDNAK